MPFSIMRTPQDEQFMYVPTGDFLKTVNSNFRSWQVTFPKSPPSHFGLDLLLWQETNSTKRIIPVPSPLLKGFFKPHSPVVLPTIPRHSDDDCAPRVHESRASLISILFPIFALVKTNDPDHGQDVSEIPTAV